MKKTLLTLSLFAALASGCSTLRLLSAEKPKVSFDSLQVQDPSYTEATLVFQLKVENPNDFGIQLDRVDYDVDLNQEDFTQGELKEGVDLAAKQTSTLAIPVRLRYLDLFSTMAQMLARDQNEYRIQGKVHVGGLAVPFDGQGNFRLPRPSSYASILGK